MGKGWGTAPSSWRGRRCGVGNDDRKIPVHRSDEVAGLSETHARWLFGHIYLRTQRDRELGATRELAADLVQDTFEAATRSWETVRSLAPAR